jgi:uncharacterized protein YecE (DUF72 family)
MATGTDHIRIGTSGWQYDHWRGSFYPEELPKTGWLEHYATHLGCVEVNNSFYNLPSEATLAEWRDGTPDGFRFAVKASRYITHMKKLKDPEEPVTRFLERVSVLEEKLGPILFQCPPNWGADPGRLEAFCQTLPDGHKYTFEFRDPSWHDDAIYDILARHGYAFCIFDIGDQQSPRQVTTDLVYVRLHGPGEPYQGSYDDEALAGWLGAFSTWARQGKDVWCFFDNDQEGYAAQNALRARQMRD